MPLSGLCAASGKFTALRSPGKDRSRELNNNMLREKHYLQNPVSWNRLGFIYFIARTVRIITMWFKCLGHQFIYMEKLQIKLFVPSVKKIYRYIIEKKNLLGLYYPRNTSVLVTCDGFFRITMQYPFCFMEQPARPPNLIQIFWYARIGKM